MFVLFNIFLRVMYILCNSADILWVRMEMESVSGSDHCVSGCAAAGWAWGCALASSSFRSLGYVRKCFTLWQRSQQKWSISFQYRQTTITLCISCVGVIVADVVPVILLNTYFLGECWASMDVLFQHIHIHTPTHTHTSDLPTGYYSPSLLTCEQLKLSTWGLNALLRGH